MKTRTHGILALAASALLTTGIVAAEPKGTNPNPIGQSPAQAGQNAGQQAQGAQQSDQACLEQLRKIAQDPATAPDKLFLIHTAIGNMWEVQLSQQALQRAENPQVKQLAQQLVTDHEQANQKLMQTAQQLGVQVPQGLPEMKQEELKIFSALPAKEFEQQYISIMNADHAKDVACFRAVSNMSKNEQVKQFAADLLPKLQQHRQMVQQAATALGITTHGDEAVPAAGHIPGSGTHGQGITPRNDSDTHGKPTPGSKTEKQ